MTHENAGNPLTEPTEKCAEPRSYGARDLERIRELAYAAYSARLGGPGDALTDWLEAEQMFLATTDIVASPLASRSMPIQSIPTRPEKTSAARQPRPGKSVTV